MGNPEDDISALVALPAILISATGLNLWLAFIASYLWDWFFVSAGAVELPWHTFYGIICLGILAKYGVKGTMPREEEEEEDPYPTAAATVFQHIALGAMIALAILLPAAILAWTLGLM